MWTERKHTKKNPGLEHFLKIITPGSILSWKKDPKMWIQKINSQSEAKLVSTSSRIVYNVFAYYVRFRYTYLDDHIRRWPSMLVFVYYGYSILGPISLKIWFSISGRTHYGTWFLKYEMNKTHWKRHKVAVFKNKNWS